MKSSKRYLKIDQVPILQNSYEFVILMNLIRFLHTHTFPLKIKNNVLVVETRDDGSQRSISNTTNKASSINAM